VKSWAAQVQELKGFHLHFQEKVVPSRRRSFAVDVQVFSCFCYLLACPLDSEIHSDKTILSTSIVSMECRLGT
jgi:hypothetical protein